jgi:hypothetical protein
MRLDLPTTKAISEETQIIAQPARFVNPTLRIKLLGFREDIWIIGDSPDIPNITQHVVKRNDRVLTNGCQ